ncbi:hypothetical protein BDQ94DRAFT_139819, partial [Aspergillus welwitschiae]
GKKKEIFNKGALNRQIPLGAWTFQMSIFGVWGGGKEKEKVRRNMRYFSFQDDGYVVVPSTTNTQHTTHDLFDLRCLLCLFHVFRVLLLYSCCSRWYFCFYS